MHVVGNLEIGDIMFAPKLLLLISNEGELAMPCLARVETRYMTYLLSTGGYLKLAFDALIDI